jgi:hypothetical protein
MAEKILQIYKTKENAIANSANVKYPFYAVKI